MQVERPQMPTDPPEMDKKTFTERILSMTLEVIHLLTGEEYIVVKKSSSCVSGGLSMTPTTILDSPHSFPTPETKNVKHILRVVNDIIHLLSGEVLGCWDDDEDPYRDAMICKQQSSASLDIPKSRNRVQGLHIQISPPHVLEEAECHRGSPEQRKGSKLSQGKDLVEDFSPDLDTSDLSSGVPTLCDIGTGTSSDDCEDLEFTVVQIKEELGRDGEDLEKGNLAKAKSSTPQNIPQCQFSKRGDKGNSQALSGTETGGSISQPNSTNSPTITNANTYSCSDCSEVFSCHSDLVKHQTHHRESPLFSCLLCGKNFTSKSNLAKHQKIHTGEKPYSCTDCGKRFREKHYLASHQAVHRGAQLILCPECGKGYTSKSNLAKHQRIHTGQKPFGCSICGKSFNQRSVLLAHQRTHTGEKPFSCDLCLRCFTDKLQLVRHQATHSEEKPYCCNECGKSFTRKNLLLKHLVAHSVGGFLD